MQDKLRVQKQIEFAKPRKFGRSTKIFLMVYFGNQMHTICIMHTMQVIRVL